MSLNNDKNVIEYISTSKNVFLNDFIEMTYFRYRFETV